MFRFAGIPLLRPDDVRIHRAAIDPVGDRLVLVRLRFGSLGAHTEVGFPFLFRVVGLLPECHGCQQFIQQDIRLIGHSHHIGRRGGRLQECPALRPDAIDNARNRIGNCKRAGLGGGKQQERVHHNFADRHALRQRMRPNGVLRLPGEIGLQARILVPEQRLHPRILQNGPEIADHAGLGVEREQLS